MKPARALLLLLTVVFLLATSCGSSPKDSSSESGSVESSSVSKGNEASASSTMTTESTVEETTSAPEMTAETAAGKTAKRAAPEKRTEEGSKGKPAGKVVEVSIRALKYLPGPVTVSPGTTVRWTNEEQARHTVTSKDSDGPLQSKELEQGESYEYTFHKPGPYDYYCTVHPFMKSGVTVE